MFASIVNNLTRSKVVSKVVKAFQFLGVSNQTDFPISNLHFRDSQTYNYIVYQKFYRNVYSVKCKKPPE